MSDQALRFDSNNSQAWRPPSGLLGALVRGNGSGNGANTNSTGKSVKRSVDSAGGRRQPRNSSATPSSVTLGSNNTSSLAGNNYNSNYAGNTSNIESSNNNTSNTNIESNSSRGSSVRPRTDLHRRRAVVQSSSSSNGAVAVARPPPRAPKRGRRRELVESSTSSGNTRPRQRPKPSRGTNNENRESESSRSRPYHPAELPTRANNPNAAVATRVMAANANWLRTEFGTQSNPMRLAPHQINACRLFAKTDGLLLFFKVGTGKTLASIAAVENLARKEGRARPVVVIVPASLIANFKKEMAAARVVDPTRYTVASFQTVNFMTPADRDRLGRGAVVVIDEAQNLRKADGKLFNSALEVAAVSHKRLLLSATPVMNFPYEIGPIIALMYANREDVVEKVARRKTGGKFKSTFVENFGVAANLRTAELDALLRCSTLFYEPSAEEVRRDYPTKSEEWVEVPMTRNQTKNQFELARHASLTLQAVNGAAFRDLELAFLSGPREINNNHNGEHPKLDVVVRNVTAEVRRGGKCIVHCFFLKNGLDIVKRGLLAAGVDARSFEGKTNDLEKRRLVQEYNAGRIRVLLLSDAGKEGLDLKNTTQVHVVAPEWNEDKIRQIIGRAVRKGSHAGPAKHVRVLRYVSVLPTDYRSMWPNAYDVTRDRLENGALFNMSADQIMRRLSLQKDEMNSVFNRRLVRISDDNLRSCL